MKSKSWAPILILALMAGACSGNSQNGREADSAAAAFSSYSYNMIAQYLEDPLHLPDGSSAYCQLQGWGVLPTKIGNADITQLRDSLMRLAKIEYTETNEVMPLLDAELKATTLIPDSVNACSTSGSQLSVVLATPKVLVWRSYNYEYSCRAAHGMYANTYVNFDIADGELVRLPGIMKAGYEKGLLELIRGELKERTDLLVPLDSVKISNNFEITTDGLTFVYGLYEIAPYAAGEVGVAIGSYELDSLLNPKGQQLLLGN